MIQTIATVLRRTIGLGPSSLPHDVDVDTFVERLQELLMSAPYSREVRALGRFARKHANPEFKQVYERKRALLDQYQRENRRPGLVSWLMYVAERYVPGTNQPSLLRDVTLTLTMVCLVVFGIEYTKAWTSPPDEDRRAARNMDLAGLHDTIRIESSGDETQGALDSSSFDQWLAGKVDAALEAANFEQMIAAKLEAGFRQNETGELLEGKLREALERTNLEELIGQQISQSLQVDGLEQQVQDGLAEMLADPELEQRVSQMIQESLTSDAFTQHLAAALATAIQPNPTANAGGP